MEGLWSAALPLLRQQVGERNFNAWIEPIHCCRSDGEIRLEVPGPFFQQWVTRHFLAAIEETLGNLGEAQPAVRVVVSSEQRQVSPRPPVPAPGPAVSKGVRASTGPRIGRLVSHYTFDNFVVGEANRIAVSAAETVSAEPGKRFNPMFLHGGVGLGKTHLINAIAHEMLRRRPRLRIACMAAESFMNTLISSLRQDQMNAFRDRFRQVDALILDDVQFLAGKERTQEEFFHTFNALYGAQKQIVLTSDKPPAVINGLEQRLRSRFEGGLIADVHPPTASMRVAIVHAKAAQHGIELTPGVVQVLVERSGASVREIEGALNQVLATAAVRDIEITTELAESVLRPLTVDRNRISIETVQETVSGRLGVRVVDMTSHRRGREISFPRQIAMYLSRTVAEASFTRIGEKFGGRDHSTVMYAVRLIEARRSSEPSIDQILAGIESELRQIAS